MTSLSMSPCIAGLGAFTPIGGDAFMSAASVRAGICRFEAHPYLVDTAGQPMVISSAQVSPELRGLERYLALVLPALEEALAPVDGPVPLVLGAPPPRPGRPERLEEELASALRRSVLGPRLSAIDILPHGHAAGLMALEAACKQLRGGVQHCLVGGVDTYLDVETLEWLDSTEQLKSERHRWGFIPGEAASFCLLASPLAATGRSALRPLAHVLAAATQREPNRIKTDTVCVGQGLTRALRQVLQGLPPDARVEQILGDLNGERYRSAEYGFASIRVRSHIEDAASIRTPADCWGDVGAASGPLFVCLAVTSALRHHAPGPLALAWAGSEGGERSAALLDLSVSWSSRRRAS